MNIYFTQYINLIKYKPFKMENVQFTLSLGCWNDISVAKLATAIWPNIWYWNWNHNYLRLDHYWCSLTYHSSQFILPKTIYLHISQHIPAPLSFFPIVIAWVEPCCWFLCCFALSCLSHLIRSLVCPPIAALFCVVWKAAAIWGCLD